MQNRRSQEQYFIIAFLLSLTIALILRFPMVMSMIFNEEEGRHHFDVEEGITYFLAETTITFIVAFAMFIMNFFILKPFDKHRRLKFKNILVAIVLTLIFVSLLNHLLFDLSRFIESFPTRRGHKDEFDVTNFFVSVIVISCILIIRLIHQKQIYELENEKLRLEGLQSQFESLKNQVSPHFLFNSLTAMKTLIRESPEIAGKYVDHLSLVLRYTLQSNEKKLVSLREELDFTDSYLFLIKMRYDSNLIIQFDIDTKQTQLMLPPLTLQTLVENSIKHNEISKRNPLSIRINTTPNETLVVSNPIQEKLTKEEGTGIGLSNLSKQYQLLGNKTINIHKMNNEFKVEVPLIKS